jgi:hypothetical protein
LRNNAINTKKISYCDHVNSSQILRKVFFKNPGDNDEYVEMCDNCWVMNKMHMEHFSQDIPEHVSIYENPNNKNEPNYPYVETLEAETTIPYKEFLLPCKSNDNVNNTNFMVLFDTHFKEEYKFWNDEMNSLWDRLGKTVYAPQVMSNSLHNKTNREVSEYEIKFLKFEIVSEEKINSIRKGNSPHVQKNQTVSPDKIKSKNRLYIFEVCLRSLKNGNKVNNEGIIVTQARGLINIIITPSCEEIVYCVFNGFKEEGKNVSKGFRKNASDVNRRKKELEKLERNKLAEILNEKQIRYNTNKKNRKARIEKLGIKYNNKTHGNDLVQLVLNNEFPNRKSIKPHMVIFEMTISDTELTVGKCSGLFIPEDKGSKNHNNNNNNTSLEGYKPTFSVFYKDKTTALQVNSRLNKKLVALPTNINNINYQKSIAYLDKYIGVWKTNTEIEFEIKKLPHQIQQLRNYQQRKYFEIDAIEFKTGVRNYYQCKLCKEWLFAKKGATGRGTNRKYGLQHKDDCMTSIIVQLRENNRYSDPKILICSHDGKTITSTDTSVVNVIKFENGDYWSKVKQKVTFKNEVSQQSLANVKEFMKEN